MTQTISLKDRNYRIIGYGEIKDNGDKVLKDANFRIKGYYDKSTDTTKDVYFRIVVHGDILTSLLNNS